MNLWTRIQVIFGAKAQAVLDGVEDPRETLEYSYQRQRELLRKVKEGLLEVATSHKHLETQAQRLRARVPQLEDQAKRALSIGREDLARLALQRKQTCYAELAQLETHLHEVAEEERKLTLTEQKLTLRVDAFRVKRDTLNARYTAAAAQVRLNETVTGGEGEFGDLGIAVERAEEKIERMQARATAIDGLLEHDTLLTSNDDSVERELRAVAATTVVEEELATLRTQVNKAVAASPTIVAESLSERNLK